MHRIDVFDQKTINITLTRGDTLIVQLSLTKNNEPYVPVAGSSIRFAMKKKYTDPDTDVVLIKDISIDTLLLEIDPEDTKSLPMKSKYVYDIQLTDEDDHIDTFIKGTFTLSEEVI